MQLIFPVTYKVDNTLAMSCDELKVTYATDIDFQGLGGQKLSCNVVEKKIKVEQEKLENILDLKITKQKLQEQQPYDQVTFREWGFIPLNYNITEYIEGNGYVNQDLAIELRDEYISIKRQLDTFRNLYVMPVGVGYFTTRLYPYVFMYGAKGGYIPNFWHISYFTGFDKMPLDIAEAIGKKAMLQVYNILGNVLFGAGIASTSKSIDGVSQSIGTTQSATNALFGASINQFQDELKQEIPALKAKYRGIIAARL